MRAALCQINTSVGDIEGNVERMRRFYAESVGSGADVVIFPEMSVCGYPPEDLLLKRHFIEENFQAIDMLAELCPLKTIIVGFAGAYEGKRYNCLAVLKDGKVQRVYKKGLLPNYGVFDERRYFEQGSEPVLIDCDGLKVAMTICLDIWNKRWLEGFFGQSGEIDLFVNISASPFSLGKLVRRHNVIKSCASHFNAAVAYCNLVGGQDELVFDGRSMVVNPEGVIAGKAEAFGEDILIVDITKKDGHVEVANVKASKKYPKLEEIDELEEVHDALVLGLRDYVGKNGFKDVLIGISGGIDSALTAAIAVEALGAENVWGITMPTRFNSSETVEDARKLAENLKIRFYTVPIGEILEQFSGQLGVIDGWDENGTAFENLQARIRGTILMSYSNQFGSMVVAAGNKSEMSVGYATLYGDMAGGFALIKDLPKTMVYNLSKYVNKVAQKEVIPVSIIERPPSAELRADQKDTDSLPDYDELDRVLYGYIEEDKGARELIAEGMDRDVVMRVIRLVDRNEYKRRQAPPGVKITLKSFGKDRRMPITNRYRYK